MATSWQELLMREATRKVSDQQPRRRTRRAPMSLDDQWKATWDRVAGFSSYEKGWYGGEGEAPSREAINAALRALKVLRRSHVQCPNTSVSTNGHIEFEWMHDDWYEINFMRDGSYRVYGKTDDVDLETESFRTAMTLILMYLGGK